MTSEPVLMTEEDNDGILLSYKGPVSSDVLADLGSKIDKSDLLDERYTRKVFKVFMEMALNISYYSSEYYDEEIKKNLDRVGSLLVQAHDYVIEVISGNLLKNDEVNELIEKCKYINSLSRRELRNYKISQRLTPSNNGFGGNIGLIVMVLTSSNPIAFDIEKVDESFSYLTLKVTLNR